jgi:excisionase family DNA binding protein
MIALAKPLTVRERGCQMGQRTAIKVSPNAGVLKRSFGEPLTTGADAPLGLAQCGGSAPTVNGAHGLAGHSDASQGDGNFEAEIGDVSTGNHHQVTVLSSQPALIGRLFLTVEEAAQRLGVTVGWIYERTRRKTIPHRKLGKFVRFTEEDLRAIVEAAAKGTMQ